jgi:hypothetical protein
MVCAAAAVLAVGCGRSERSTGDAAPASSAPAAAAITRTDDASSPRPRWGDAVRAGAHLPCRAVAVDGLVRAEDLAQPGAAHGRAGADAGGGMALALQQDIPESWLTLAPSSRLVAKDPRTTRETTFLGGGRVRPCVDRREESWVAAGTFESVVGAGESPGSEEWLVTPLAVLRYASAKLRVAVGPKGTSITPSAGVTFAWLADDARARPGSDADAGTGAPRGVDAGSAGAKVPAADGWERVADVPWVLEPTASMPAPQAARASVDRCAALADRSHELAQLLMAPSVGLPDASAAADQVIARRQARAACAVAALRVDALAEAPAKDALAAKLAESVAAWTALPSP